MTTALQSSPPYAAGRVETAFERNSLPGFARWLIQRIEQRRPDFLVPAETRGARMLEAALDYAREELGAPITVPTIYATALAFVDREILARSRVMVIDDAVRTGTNLERHRGRVQSYGVEDIDSVACIGHGDRPADVDCYRVVDSSLYREHVWQLTELLVARGLPPEVDHHVFELRLPARLPAIWPEIADCLGRHGSLSIDAPAWLGGELVGMTLHFPDLPGVPTPPRDGPVRDEGANKLRLFVDAARDVVYLVPVSYPELSLACDADLSRSETEAMTTAWTGRSDGVGRALAAEARRRDPDTVYRMLSTCGEVELVRGLARVLATTFPGGGISLTCERGHFHRLYGERVGERIANSIEEDVVAALGEVDRDDPGPPRAPLFADAAVAAATRAIAEQLKLLFEQRSKLPDYDAADRVGLPLSEIAARLPDRGNEEAKLLASRCVDYGLAMTTLVPYVDRESLDDGRIRVRRMYRVSEVNRDEQQYEDIAAIDLELSQETVGLIAHYVREESERWSGRPVPERLVSRLIAILGPLVLRDRGIGARLAPGEADPVLLLRDSADPVRLDTGPDSDLYERVDGSIVTTTRFHERYEQDLLRLDLRRISESVEGRLDLLMPLIDELDPNELDVLLDGWAMCTDRRLGLTYVRHSLRAALQRLEQPLRLIQRGQPHHRSVGAGLATRNIAQSALRKIGLLASDWPGPVRQRWQETSKRKRRMLESLGAPREPGAIYELAGAVAEMVASTSRLVELLDVTSVRVRNEGGDPGDVPAQILAWCARVDRVLVTLEPGPLRDMPVPPADPSIAVTAAADALLATVRRLDTVASALAGEYRGRPGGRATSPHAGERRATVLFADLEKSFEYALRHGLRENLEWTNGGLNVMAQWGRAFGGWEGRDREGDAVWLEFDGAGDGAALCGAVLQEHLSAFRSAGLPDRWWGMRAAIDIGVFNAADGGNAIGRCISRAAKLAKELTDEQSITRVLATPEAAELWSATLRGTLTAPLGSSVTLADEPLEGATFEPYSIAPDAVVKALAQRIGELAGELATLEVPAAQDTLLEAVDVDTGEAEAAS
jgi:class 3 adenylate cyclase